MGAPSNCTACPLHQHRTTVVNGRIVGTESEVPVMVVGEGPGIQEDSKGLPFIGPTGAYLAQALMLRGINSYALTNATRCHPGETKKDSEMAAGIKACAPYLLEDINEIHPKVILALGAWATRALGFNDPMGTILCHTLEGPNGIPVVVSYHPSYFMRDAGNLHLFDIAVLKVRLLRDGVGYGKSWPPQLLTLEEMKNAYDCS